jgi:hypothetical protein
MVFEMAMDRHPYNYGSGDDHDDEKQDVEVDDNGVKWWMVVIAVLFMLMGFGKDDNDVNWWMVVIRGGTQKKPDWLLGAVPNCS